MSRSSEVRLFAALDPPEEVRRELVRWARSAAGEQARAQGQRPARVLEADSLHLTLCFLGGRPADEIEPLSAAVAGLSVELGPLQLGAPVWLPPRRPRALAVEASEDEGRLTVLHGRLLMALEQASGWQAGRERLRPHITVARTRAGAAVVVAAGPLAPTPALSFHAESLSLYRSELLRAGARYEQLACAPVVRAP